MKNVNNSKTLMFVTLKKWWVILGVVLAFALVVMPFDIQQQNQYYTLRQAYDQIENGQYKEALKNFEEYKNAHTSIYWRFFNLVNGRGSEYSLEEVEDAIKMCQEKIKMDSGEK